MLTLLSFLLILASCSNITNNEVEVYFCPADYCQGEILKELVKAHESIYFLTYSFTDQKIASLLVEKSESIIVEGVIERQRITSKYNVYNYLKAAGIDVVPDNNDALMHDKIFIIDEKTVVTGSYNPTQNGNENNNENVVIIHDKRIAKMYKQEFLKIKNLQ